MQGVIRIAIIDDHRIFLEGVSLLVKGMGNQFSVTGFAAPHDILREIEAGKTFDLVICDLIMNSMNGLAFVAALRSHTKRIPILILSGINTAPPIDEIRRLGGNGFVHKSVENHILLSAIETALAGGTYFADGLEACVINAPLLLDNKDVEGFCLTKAIPKLGPRQIEVLRLIASGASNKDIANMLTISENTVKSHIKQIFTELGVNKRTACVRKAETLGLI